MIRIFLSLLCFAAMVTLAETSDEERLALRNGAIGRYIYRVVDDDGIPVVNASAHVWFRSYGRPQDKADWVIQTDTNGMFTAEHRFNEKFSFGIDKEGYYHTHGEINYFSMAKRDVKDGKWQPYGDTRTVVLKKIKKPQDLINSMEKCYVKYPEYGVWTGFDLEKFDWCEPIGRGEIPDMMIRFTREELPDGYIKTMDVSFTNNPYAGAYEMIMDCYSEMRTTYCADTNAVFKGVLSYKFIRDKKGSQCHDLPRGTYLVFRVRPIVDENGKLVSANYGRIYGTWSFYERIGMKLGPIVFNPNPNDTNLEDAETARKSRLRYKQKLEFERQRKAKVK